MCPGERRQSSLRSVVAIAAILWLLAGVAEFEYDPPSAPDTAHTVLTSFTGAVIANGDHLHLKQLPSPECPKTFDAGVLPELVPGLIPMGLLAALLTVAGWVVERLHKSGRSPPQWRGAVAHGQDLLTRFCIARC